MMDDEQQFCMNVFYNYYFVLDYYKYCNNWINLIGSLIIGLFCTTMNEKLT